MRSIIFFTACLLQVQPILHAQTAENGFTCGANEQPALFERIAADPSVLQQALNAQDELETFTAGFVPPADRSAYVIPVVFHIIHNNGPENISDDQVYDAVRILNEDFNQQNPEWQNVRPEFLDLVADVGIEFRLALRDPNGDCTNGITRTFSTQTYAGDFDMTQLIQWPRQYYMNVWVAASANGAAGYTYYPMWLNNWPEADGIVLKHDYLGSIGTGAVSRSHVLAHEVGHWLNLMHCWGNSNEPGSLTNCNMDDGVSDTPNTKGWTSCALFGASCGSALDNVENFMEYSYCCKMFTHGQGERMLAALTSPIAQRNQLWSAGTLALTGVFEEALLCSANFIHSRPEVCAGNSVQYTDMSYHNVVSRTWSFPGGDPVTSTEVSPIVTYNEPGVHTVTLEVTDGASSMTRTEVDLVHVHAVPGLPVPLFEGFEEDASFSGIGWSIKDNDLDGNSFVITDVASYSGQRSLMIQNEPNMIGRIDELRSPTLDMSDGNGMSISFRYAFANRSTDNRDRLRVHASINCGVTWSIRKQFFAHTTLTTAGFDHGYFIPQGPEEWELGMIDIANTQFHIEDVRIRFEFLSDGGNNLFLDDINIHNSPVGLEEMASVNENDLLLVPNPAGDQAQLIVSMKENSNVRISIFDPLGREMNVVRNGTMASGDHYIDLPISALASGVYFIQVDQGNRSSTMRLIKE